MITQDDYFKLGSIARPILKIKYKTVLSEHWVVSFVTIWWLPSDGCMISTGRIRPNIGMSILWETTTE